MPWEGLIPRLSPENEKMIGRVQEESKRRISKNDLCCVSFAYSVLM
jgi:hypothetical protein